jgi:hypothetical protein
VFEISALNKEVGAAIVVPPNEANSGLFRIRRRESESCRLFWGKQGVSRICDSVFTGNVHIFADGSIQRSKARGHTVTVQNGCKYDGYVRISPEPCIFGDHMIYRVWQACMCLRRDLHDELKRLALEEGRGGSPVRLHLSTQIVDCDTEAGILTSKSSEKFEADVIIAADGKNVGL